MRILPHVLHGTRCRLQDPHSGWPSAVRVHTARLLPQLTSDCILRRTKEDVASDMPPRIIRDAFTELTPAQRESYAMAEKQGVVQLNTLGGADTITVNDLTGTDVTQVAIDLAAPAGSGQGDGQPDTVIVNGTAGDDTIKVASSGASIVVNGLAAQVTINGTEAGNGYAG